MATLVCFHAHPDDEAISTAGTMALAADAGHRVVVVVATRGERGEPVPGVLGPDEELWRRREQETRRSAEVLGVERVEFLGYVDSGMMGEPTNDDPRCFWRADVQEAAARLAGVLDEVGADVLTVYDDHGGYGHPDHIQVHRVGRRAAELAGIPPHLVFAATMNRDEMTRMQAEGAAAAEAGEVVPAVDSPQIDLDTFGLREVDISHAVDVTSVLDRKRDAMRAHSSQISPDDFFLAVPDEMFAAVFGTEWYASLGRPRPAGAPLGRDLFEEVARVAGGERT